MEESKDCYSDVEVLFRRRRKRMKIFGEGKYLFFWRRKKTGKEKGETIWRRSLQKSKSVGFGLGLKTFANIWRVLVSVSENLVSGKKSQFWFRKI